MGMTQSSCWAMISMRVHISTHSPAAVDALRLHALLVGVKKRINKKKEKRNEGFSDEIRKTKTQIGKLGTEEYYVRLGWLNGTPSYLFLLFYSLHLFCLVRFIYFFFLLLLSVPFRLQREERDSLFGWHIDVPTHQKKKKITPPANLVLEIHILLC